MALEELSRLLKAFYDREINDLSLYVEGFGGFFLSRTKDGMVIGYIDENKRFGIDDHITFFFDRQEVKGMHRKVIDENNVVYIKYNVDYFRSPDGIKKLLRDTQRRGDVPFGIKILPPTQTPNPNPNPPVIYTLPCQSQPVSHSHTQTNLG